MSRSRRLCTRDEGPGLLLASPRLREGAVSEPGSDLHLGILDAAPDGVLVVGDDGVIRLANDQARLLFGRELVGIAVEELVPEPLRADHLHHRADYASDARRRPMGSGLELVALRADGAEFPVEISLSPGSGKARGLVIVTVRDIAERLEADRERERVREELAIQREHEMVANDLHDDLVQTLYALGLSLLTLRTDRSVSKDEALDLVQTELNAAIADLRAYVHHLRQLGDSDSWLLRERLKQLVESLPQPPHWDLDVWGELDDHALERQVYLMVRELASNVVRHADAEQAQIMVAISPDEISVDVSDDGSGFERARVADTSLGLRSMEDRVSALGGSILIESMLDVGTVVRIKLPHPSSD